MEIIHDILEAAFMTAIVILLVIAIIALLVFSVWAMFLSRIWWLILIGFICFCISIGIIWVIFENL